MNLEFVNIKDRGIKDKERIVLRALNNIDIGYYLVFLSKVIDNDSFEATPKNIFWFPDKEIKQNDLVILYTKGGKPQIKINESGTTSHFYYWHLPNPVFASEDYTSVVIEAKGWIYNK